MILHKGVPKDNFYVSSYDFHRNLQTHHFLTPLGYRAFYDICPNFHFDGPFLMVLPFRNDRVSFLDG
jgi:hypothetical protein